VLLQCNTIDDEVLIKSDGGRLCNVCIYVTHPCTCVLYVCIHSHMCVDNAVLIKCNERVLLQVVLCCIV